MEITTTSDNSADVKFIYVKPPLCKNCKFWNTLRSKMMHLEWGVCENESVMEKTSSTFSLETRGDFGCVDYKESLG